MTDTLPSRVSTPSLVGEAIDALQALEAARLVLQARTQAVHNVLAGALSNAVHEGDVVHRGWAFAETVNPTVLVRGLGVVRGRSHNADAFQVVSPPVLNIDVDHLENSTWTCDAFPISNVTGQPMSGRVRRGYAADERSTVTLRGYVAQGFYGIACSQDASPADKIAAFVATFATGRPNVAKVRADQEIKAVAQRQTDEAETLRRSIEGPENFQGDFYLARDHDLRGPGLR